MDTPQIDKTANNSDANKMAAALAPAPSTSTVQKSWGDKYKASTLHFIRDYLVNYAFNALFAVGFSYVVFKSRAKPAIDNFIKNTGMLGQKHLGIPAFIGEFVAKFFSMTQLVLVSGHLLMPFMRDTHNNKNRYEFRIGHKLDLLQEFVGKGNAASKHNIEEYNQVASLISVGDHNLRESNPVAAQITDEDKALLAKNHVNENLQFKENHLSWKHVITARASGVAATTSLGILLGLASAAPWKKIRVEETYLHPIADQIRNYLTRNNPLKGKVPEAELTGKLFGIKIGDPKLIGTFFVLELIYTLFSKIGFDRMEKKIIKKEQEGLALKEAAPNTDKQLLSQIGIRPEDADDIEKLTNHSARVKPAPESRAKIKEQGEMDFRGRQEATKSSESSMAIS